MASLRLRYGHAQPSLLILLFHTLFHDEAEQEREVVYPTIGMTVPHFQAVIAYLIDNGFTFVAPSLIPDNLKADGQYALITFDDGYYNNTRVLPILHRFCIPALFFISANHILEHRAYWWDVVYRSCRRKGMSHKAIDACINRLKHCRHEEIHTRLSRDLGSGFMHPVGDLDRPLTPEELRDFVQDPWVHIGNHTSNHAILTNYTPEEIHKEIQDAQEALHACTGILPDAVSYPNGNYTEHILMVARQCGLRLGITVDPRINPVPLDTRSHAMMRLGRFMPVAHRSLMHQCRLYHARTRSIGWWGR
jgi:peptidoglycan/xylan/chitin deacetylase (PgdA/CDA1 family)